MIRRLPLKKVHFYVIFCLLIFFIVQSLKFFQVHAPDWVFYYLNDFLLIPMVALLGLHVVWFIKNDTSIRLNIFTILSLVLLFSLVFEYYLPQKSPEYTADLRDVFAYFLGGVVFLILQKLE